MLQKIIENQNMAFSGFISSALAVSIVHPIDVIKTNYQNNTSKADIKSIIRKISSSNANMLSKGFYRGLSAQLATYPVFYSAFFMINKSEYVKDFLNKSEYIKKDFHPVLKTLTASTVATAISNPLFVLKTRFQTNKGSGTGYFNYTKNMIKQEGLLSLQKGFPVSLLNNLKLCIQFPLTYYLNNAINTGNSSVNIVLSAFIAKTFTSGLLYPTDLIRIRQRASTTPIKMTHIIKSVIAENGFIGLWRGLLLYNCVSIPSYVLTMLFMQLLADNC